MDLDLTNPKYGHKVFHSSKHDEVLAAMDYLVTTGIFAEHPTKLGVISNTDKGREWIMLNLKHHKQELLNLSLFLLRLSTHEHKQGLQNDLTDKIVIEAQLEANIKRIEIVLYLASLRLQVVYAGTEYEACIPSVLENLQPYFANSKYVAALEVDKHIWMDQDWYVTQFGRIEFKNPDDLKRLEWKRVGEYIINFGLFASRPTKLNVIVQSKSGRDWIHTMLSCNKQELKYLEEKQKKLKSENKEIDMDDFISIGSAKSCIHRYELILGAFALSSQIC